MNVILQHLYEPLQKILTDEDIIELNASTSGKAYLEIPKMGRVCREYSFLDRSYWESLCHVMANLKGLTFDPLYQPILSTQLPEGHRFQAMVGHTVETGFDVSIRVKRKPQLTLEDFGVTGEFKQDLLSMIKSSKTILISGGTSSGKTTFMNILIQEIPLHKRILTVEDTRELIVPHEDSVSYVVSRNEKDVVVGYAQVIDHMMRSRPDIILGGEVSTSNAFPILRLLNTGHGGFMTTIHAESPLDALKHTFPQNIMLAELNIKDSFSFLKSKIDLVIQLKKLGPDNRGITEAYFPKEERQLFFNAPKEEHG